MEKSQLQDVSCSLNLEVTRTEPWLQSILGRHLFPSANFNLL